MSGDRIGIEKNVKDDKKWHPAVNFINVKRARFLYERHFGSFFLVTCMQKKAVKTTFVLKRRKFNVDEIDTCRGQPFLFDLSPNLSNVQSLFVFKIIFQSYVIFLRVVLSN